MFMASGGGVESAGARAQSSCVVWFDRCGPQSTLDEALIHLI